MIPCQIRAYVTAARTAGDAQARDQLERPIECLHGDNCEHSKIALPWPSLSVYTLLNMG